MWRPTTDSDTLMHYSKGQRAKNHKYLDIINGRYIYPSSKNSSPGASRSSKNTSVTPRSKRWSDNIIGAPVKTNTHGGSTGSTTSDFHQRRSSSTSTKNLSPGQSRTQKKVAANNKRIDSINARGKSRTEYEKQKAENLHKNRNAQFTAAAKRNAGANRSGGNGHTVINKKKENQVQRGLRKLSLNLKLLANKVPGVVPIRKLAKKAKKKK